MQLRQRCIQRRRCSATNLLCPTWLPGCRHTPQAGGTPFTRTATLKPTRGTGDAKANSPYQLLFPMAPGFAGVRQVTALQGKNAWGKSAAASSPIKIGKGEGC